MSRITEILAAGYLARHCTDPGCPRCRARAHWYRRKSWRTGNTATRKGPPKELMHP